MLSKLKSNFFHRLNVRLTLYYTCILLCLFVLVTSFFLYRLQHNFIKYIDQILRDELIELSHEIEDESARPLSGTVIADALPAIMKSGKSFEEAIANRKHFPLYFRIVDTAGTVLYSSNMVIKNKPLKQIILPSIKTGDNLFFSFDAHRRVPFRCYQKRIKINGEKKYIIQMVTSTRQTNDIFKRMLRHSLVMLVVVLFFSIFFGLYASHKPFEIMRRMNLITKKITAQNIKERLPVPKANSEVRDLTETINGMLDRLEKSFVEVMQFSADVAHELRNPVFAVKGELEVMLSGERTNEEFMEMAGSCLERLSGFERIINDLFLISRFDQKKIPMDLTLLNFSTLLQDLYVFFLPIAQEKHLDFAIGVCEEKLVSKADKTRIQQFMSNLIDNAIKFTPEQGSVMLSLERHKDFFEFRVRDTGIGIPEGKMPHIFKRFYQVDNARTGTNRGVGLGLQICQRIAEAHSGTISVQRNPDQGVTFIVKLPIQV